MKSFFLGLAEKFDALAKRERYLVAVALLGGVLLIGWTTIIDPARSRAQVAERAIVEQRAQLAALAAQWQAQQSTRDPEAQAGAELVDIKRQIKALYDRYAALGGSLVAPQQVASLLEDMLGGKSNLRLLSLRTLPVAPVIETKNGVVEATAAKAAALLGHAAAGLYKHGVEIRLEGGYADLAEYLQRLEKSPQKLLWSSVTLSAENHPKLVLTLTVFTLSLDRTWLIV